MKKELTIEHLAAYLPYGVTIKHNYFNHYGLEDHTLSILSWYNIKRVKSKGIIIPLLRPLSQLTETIEHNGERFVPSQKIDDMGYRVHPLTYESIGVHALPYWVMQLLLSWHFDIFQLCDSGLAEPIPSIEQP
jgi:hypothetical protein